MLAGANELWKPPNVTAWPQKGVMPLCPDEDLDCATAGPELRGISKHGPHWLAVPTPDASARVPSGKPTGS